MTPLMLLVNRIGRFFLSHPGAWLAALVATAFGLGLIALVVLLIGSVTPATQGTPVDLGGWQ